LALPSYTPGYPYASQAAYSAPLLKAAPVLAAPALSYGGLYGGYGLAGYGKGLY